MTRRSTKQSVTTRLLCTSQKMLQQCDTKEPEIGNITDAKALDQNIADNALPPEIVSMTIDNYDEFLNMRRHLNYGDIVEHVKTNNE